MIKATEVFLKLGRICFQQGARLSSSPAMCTRDSIFHSTPTQHGFGAKPARDGKDILHAPNQCWATVTRPCGTPFETGVFLVEIEFRNSRTRLKVLAEKCRRNRSRGRLQPPGRRETQSGFSPGLSPNSFDAIQWARLPARSVVCVPSQIPTTRRVKPGLKPNRASTSSGG